MDAAGILTCSCTYRNSWYVAYSLELLQRLQPGWPLVGKTAARAALCSVGGWNRRTPGGRLSRFYGLVRLVSTVTTVRPLTPPLLTYQFEKIGHALGTHPFTPRLQVPREVRPERQGGLVDGVKASGFHHLPQGCCVATRELLSRPEPASTRHRKGNPRSQQEQRHRSHANLEEITSAGPLSHGTLWRLQTRRE